MASILASILSWMAFVTASNTTSFISRLSSFCSIASILDSRLSWVASIQTGSRPHPASYPMGTGGSYPEMKLPGRENRH
jgi:hypothetical protein